MRLLLISNSYSFGRNYLDHCIDDIAKELGYQDEVVFVPYALHNLDEYTNTVANRFKEINVQIIGLNTINYLEKAIKQAGAIFVGGGNTFRLLKKLYDYKLIEIFRKSIKNNTLYIGSSAGAVIAGDSIKTTNDMPIVFPPSFNSLSLVPFNINPHYLDTDLNTKIMMETREERIKQYCEETDKPVLGIREDSWIYVEDKKLIIRGKTGAIWFDRNGSGTELPKNKTIEIHSLLSGAFLNQ